MKANRFVLTLITLLALLCALPVFAGEPLNVAVVDIQRCVTESVRGKELNEEFIARAEAIRAELTVEEGKIRAMAADLEKQQMLLSETAMEERKREIIARQQAFKQSVEDKQEVIRKDSDELTELVLRDLQGILRDMVEQGGYDLVFSNRGPWLLHWDEKMDITDELIRRYDESMKKAE